MARLTWGPKAHENDLPRLRSLSPQSETRQPEVCMQRSCFLFTILFVMLIASHSSAQRSDSAANYTSRAMARYAHGDLDGAISDLDIAIAFDPGYAAAFYNRGQAQHDTRNHDNAIEDHSRRTAIAPRLAQAYNNRCAALKEKGELDNALADCNKA